MAAALDLAQPETAMAAGVTVLTRRNIFRPAADESWHPAGSTLDELRAAVGLGIPPGCTAIAEISHAAHAEPAVFDPATWQRVRPNGGTVVRFSLRPGDGGGGDKDTTQIVLSIAILAAAVAAQVFIPGIGGALLAAGITAVGALTLQAISPPPRQSLGTTLPGPGDGGAFERLAAVTGGTNTVNPYGPIPEPFGRHRIFPDVAGRGYTEIAGEDQFWRVLFAMGGPVRITDIKLGDTPIGSFEEVEIAIREGRPTDGPLTIYTNDTEETALQIELTAEASWQERDSAQDADEISLDFQAPAGVYRIDGNGNSQTAEVLLEVEYRAAGTADPWLPVPWIDDKRYGAADTQGFPAPGQVVLRSNAAKTFRLSNRFAPSARGQWSVRVRRTTPDTESNRIFDKVFWTALRTIRLVSPIDSLRNPATIELRIKASGQLNQQIERLSCIAERYVDVWTGSAYVEQLSRNPAWAALAVLRGPGTRRKVPENRLALDEFVDFADFCATNGYRFDGIFRGGNVRQVCNDIMSAGRASLWENDLYGVVIDRPLGPPVQVFTPTNSFGYQGERVFNEDLDAFRARFKNEEVDWEVDEAIIYNDGFDENNADPNKMQAIEYPGLTSFDLVFGRARFDQKQLKLRPVKHSFGADAEILVCRRGDPVEFSHDVPSIGISSGRIQSIITDGGGNATGLVLTVPAAMEAGQTYGIGIRRTRGNIYLVRAVVTDPGEHTTITLSEIIAAADMVAEGDLYNFGETALETMAGIVKGITYQRDEGARVEIYAAAPAVHDPGPTPPFQSFISPSARTLKQPSIQFVATDETAIVELPGGALETGAVFILNPPGANDPKPGTYEMRFREDGAPNYSTVSSTAGDNNAPRVGGLVQGKMYDLQIRSVRGADESAWLTVEGVTIIGKATPPPDVTALSVQQNGAAVTASWTPVTVIDLKAYELLYGPRTDPGGAANAIFLDELTKAEQITTTLVPPGDWRFYIRAKDSAFPPNRSENAATADLIVGNTFDILAGGAESPRWAGTKTGLERHWLGTLVPSSTKAANELTNAELFEQFVPFPVAVCEYETPERIISPNDPTCRLWTTHSGYLRPVATGEAAEGFPALVPLVDHRLTAGSYDGYEIFVGVATVEAGAFKAKLVHDPAVSGPGVITNFSATADIDPRSETHTVDTPATGWKTVIFTTPFAGTPGIQVSAEAGPGGAVRYGQWQNATSLQVEVNVVDGSATQVAGRASVTAEGA